MPGARFLHIIAKLSEPGRDAPRTRRLCDVATEVTALSGAGIMLLSGNLPQGSLCTTNPVSTLIEDLQYTLGEGPCVDAHASGEAVFEPDLASPSRVRWPAFAPPAVEAGARAVFGFPVRIGAARLGALNLYCDRAGPLSDEQHADALVMAEVAARAILDMQADASPGTLAEELATGANFQLVVHQAAGMISVQLGVSVDDALVRLRSVAFADNRLVADVATDVVEHRLRFEGGNAE